MPALFVGHGSPLNAIQDNEYTRAVQERGRKLPKPKAVLVISAHWMTSGSTMVTHMKFPKTIHDFSGFPKELFQVNYPAPGSPETAERVQKVIGEPSIILDKTKWGLDHGAWSVLCHLFPRADVPVVQLSLDMTKNTDFHFELGQKLSILRDEGILILGSGNIVHNLRAINWDKKAKPHDWAIEFDEWAKKNIVAKNDSAFLKDATSSMTGKLSNPTLDHYYPLLYVLGCRENSDKIKFFYEGIQNASISMRSFIFT